jgi:hypothetical protein
MNVFQIDILKSFGGRSSRFHWRNSHFVAAPIAINSPELREAVSALVACERPAHYQDVHFMYAHAKGLTIYGQPAPSDDFVTIQLQDRGARVLNGELMPLEIVLEIQRDCETGRSGALSLRGCLSRDDVVNTADNTFELASLLPFDGAGEGSPTIIDRLNNYAGPGTLCIPEKKGLIYHSYRNVVKHRIGGVGIRQTTARRRTIQSADVNVHQRGLNQIAKDVRRLKKTARNGVLSPATVGLIADLIADGLSIYNALTPAKRALVILPELIALV